MFRFNDGRQMSLAQAMYLSRHRNTYGSDTNGPHSQQDKIQQINSALTNANASHFSREIDVVRQKLNSIIASTRDAGMRLSNYSHVDSIIAQAGQQRKTELEQLMESSEYKTLINPRIAQQRVAADQQRAVELQQRNAVIQNRRERAASLMPRINASNFMRSAEQVGRSKVYSPISKLQRELQRRMKSDAPIGHITNDFLFNILQRKDALL